LLQNVQDVVHRQKLHVLDDGGDDAQRNEDQDDGDVQAVFQQEVPGVEGVLVVFPPLGDVFAHRELGQPQHVDQVVLVVKGGVAAVLDGLQLLVAGHLGVKQPVFVDVLFVLEFLRVADLGHGGLVFLFQLGHRLLVAGLGGGALLLAAGHHMLVVLGVVVGLQVGFGVGDQPGDLVLVLGLHRLGFFQVGLHPAFPVGLLLGGVDAV